MNALFSYQKKKKKKKEKERIKNDPQTIYEI